MVNLYDIHVHKRENNYLETSPELEAKMLSLEEYESIAKHCIGTLVAGPVARIMLRDEDAIAHVMHCLIGGHDSLGRARQPSWILEAVCFMGYSPLDSYVEQAAVERPTNIIEPTKPW